MKSARTTPDLFRTNRAAWVEECRETARKLLKQRRTININDVLRECPKPAYIKSNTIGCIFQHSDFTFVGWTKSTKKSAHGRYVKVWVLK